MEIHWSFLLFTLGFAGTPGSSTALVVQSSCRGRRAGLQTVVGIVLGNWVWASGTALGMGQILMARPSALALLSGIGGFLLLAVAARTSSVKSPTRGNSLPCPKPVSKPSGHEQPDHQRQDRGPEPETGRAGACPPTLGWASFLLGLAASLTNVSVILFYVTMVPSFVAVKSNQSLVWSLLAHNFVYVGMAALIHSSYALGVSSWLGRPSFSDSQGLLFRVTRWTLALLGLLLLWRGWGIATAGHL